MQVISCGRRKTSCVICCACGYRSGHSRCGRILINNVFIIKCPYHSIPAKICRSSSYAACSKSCWVWARRKCSKRTCYPCRVVGRTTISTYMQIISCGRGKPRCIICCACGHCSGHSGCGGILVYDIFIIERTCHRIPAKVSGSSSKYCSLRALLV